MNISSWKSAFCCNDMILLTILGFGGKVCDTPLSDDPSGFQSSR